MRRRCVELFLTFFRIGLFTFGGGYAMISLIEAEVATRRGWITSEELTEMVAVAESTPGPIAVNCATYVGYRQAGVPGSAAATLGVVLPSFVIIYAISLFLDTFMRLEAVAHAFKGIEVAVAFLVLRAGLRLTVKLPRTACAAAAWAAAFALVLCMNLFGWTFSTVWLIVCGAASGLILLRGGDAR